MSKNVDSVMGINMVNQWEGIDKYTYRLKVYRGWMVETIQTRGDVVASSSIFVPDPDHEWVVGREVTKDSQDERRGFLSYDW